MSKYVGVVISDIHVGAFNLKQLRKEFDEIFLKHIYSMEKLDFLIIDGDFFDYKFFLRDEESTTAHSMLEDIISVCKEKNTALRIIYGTEGHECGQYEVIKVLTDYDNFRVIKFAEAEELLPGMHVLYLPEEQIFDKNEYYKDFFNEDKRYDYVFGHGVIREVMKEAASQIEEKENSSTSVKRKKVPVFSSAELSRICKGQVYFGHYHNMRNIDDKVFYVGSFSRWKFGEDDPKGFFVISCNPEKEKYKSTFIENTLAEVYRTINYGFNSEVFTSEEKLVEAFNMIDGILSNNILNHVKCVFNIPDTVENPEGILNTIKEHYRFKDNIKTDIVHGYIDKRREQQKEQIDTENLKYNFIEDENMPLEEQCSRFISIEYNQDLSTDTISLYLYNSLNDILAKTEELDKFKDQEFCDFIDEFVSSIRRSMSNE